MKMKPARILFLLMGSLIIHGCADFQRQWEWSKLHDTTLNFATPIFRDVYYNKGVFGRINYNDSTHSFATFDYYTDEPDASYKTRFPSFSKGHSPFKTLFRPGDSVIVVTRKTHLFAKDVISSYAGRFEAYYPYGVKLDDGTTLPMAEVDSIIDIRKKSFLTKEDLVSLLENNAVPVRSTLFSVRLRHTIIIFG
jgi:hypothetical protein